MTLEVIVSGWRKLSTKMVGALIALLILALIAISITLALSWQIERSADAINESSRLRMHTYRLNMLLSRHELGPNQGTQAPAAGRQVGVIDATLERLQHGESLQPMLLLPSNLIRAELERIEVRWRQALRPQAMALLGVGAAKPEQVDLSLFLQQSDGFAAQVDGLARMIERDSDRRTNWLRASQLALLGLALFGTVIAIYLTFKLVIAPLTRLREGMARMTDKDFEVRLSVESDDEFGQLARGFNRMADRLQALYGNLEEGVRSKTATLEDQNRELALLYDITAFLQRPQPVEALCDGFLKRIRDYFVADGGTVRMLEANRGNVHMVVHHGLSPALMSAERCIKVGQCLCGTAVGKKISVVHDLRRSDLGASMPCYAEGFRTVAVFHIGTHGQHLGFFNLHFFAPREFSVREEALLETVGQALGIALENQRLVVREREMAISEERNLVAQGLHDSIAQSLNFLNLQVQMLDDSVRHTRFDEVAGIVPALRVGVQESYEDVRELLQNFRGRLMEDDLIGSLQAAVDKFRRQTGIEAELIADVDGAPFPREQQLQLLFIVQEALSNIRKHAQAERVEVRLQDREDFCLTVSDDGVGFDPETRMVDGDAHVGVHIMRERAQRIDAAFEVRSRPGKGTTIELHLRQAQRRAA